MKIIGKAILEVKDAETLEVKRTQEVSNNITSWMADQFYQFYGNFSQFSPGNSVYSFRTMLISPRRFHTGVRALERINDTYTRANQFLDLGTYHSGDPEYLEFKGRFTAPATPRTIYTIGMTQSYIGSGGLPSDLVVTLATLDTPCTQSTTEVLDVTYRILFVDLDNYVVPTGNALPQSPLYTKSLLRWAMFRDELKVPVVLQYNWHKCHNQSFVYNTWGVKRYTNAGRTNASYFMRRLSFTWTATTSTDVGSIKQSMDWGNYTGSNTSVHQGSTLFSPFSTDAFINKPVQPIHNHNSTAIAPFLDVDRLATSQGTINVSGTNWTDPDFPDFHRIEYSSSGDVSVAKYFLRTRKLAGGFSENTYTTALGALSFISGYPTQEYIPGITGQTMQGGHGSTREYPQNIEEYDRRSVVLFDSIGISLVDIIDGAYYNFDSTTTPALPVTTITQIACPDSGDIWVACAGTGLYRITDPKGVPTVTKMTVAGNGIPAENNCYGVCRGNGRIWAVFQGGLCYTTDNGTSWTVLNESSSPVFSYTGITGTWQTVKYIRADENSPTHQLGLVYFEGADYKVCWWSNVTAATAGPTSIKSHAFSYPYHAFKCSRYGSMWAVQKKVGTYSATMFLGAFNSSMTVPCGDITQATNDNASIDGSARNNNICFVYDYYKVPYVIGFCFSNPYSLYARYQLVRADGTRKGEISHTVSSRNGQYYQQTVTPIFTFETDYGDGFWFRWYYPDYSGPINDEILSITPSNDLSQGIGFSVDALNGQYSVFEECVWRKHHWNGSSWQKDYYAPAINSVIGSAVGVRHNFNTESHFFTGRSNIDSSASFPASTYGNNATFAFTVNPSAKLTSVFQDANACVFDISTQTQIFRIWTIKSSNLVIEHGTPASLTSTTITTSPINGVDTRIVVTISGNTITTYINGVQTGPIITAAITYDLSNTDSTLKSYIGSNVYNLSIHQMSPQPMFFFRGSVKNLQMWNTVWTQTDVTDDMTDITGVISTISNTLMTTRFQLNESLVETKLTHELYEDTVDGIQVKFNRNLTSPNSSCVAGDYYTCGIVDGILKDNVMSLTQTSNIYVFMGSDVNFSTFTNSVGTNLIPATSSEITETILWSQAVGSNMWRYVPGHCGSTINAAVAISVQCMSTNGYITWSFNSDSDYGSHVGLTTDVTGSALTNPGFWIRCATTGNNVDIIENGSVVSSAITTYTTDDVFKITRVGTVITYYKNDVLIYTSSNTSSGSLYFKVITSTNPANRYGNGVINATINYILPANILHIGNQNTTTGRFNPRFRAIETDVNSALQGIFIDSLNAPGTAETSLLSLIVPPSPGAVKIHRDAGWLIFNSADATKQVTGTCTVLIDTL